MEEAVKLLVEHLVKPVLPQGLEQRYMVLEKESAAAQQVRRPHYMHIARPFP